MDRGQWDALRGLGLTENETAAYVGLLESGPTTAGPLAGKTGLHRSRAYAALERLLEKGLVSTIVRNARHYYQALPPETLLDVVEEKRRRIEAVVPALNAIRPQEPMHAGMHEGIHAFRLLREKILADMAPGDVMRVQGAPAAANERMEAFLLDFHHRREAKGCALQIIYNADARPYGKKREKLRLSQVRYMRNPVATASWIEIYRDTVLINVIGSTLACFVVQDPKVRDSFAAYFDELWKNAKK
ncbi:helix-turn-helix domain-containing protein [Candidatus Micrarchaeota archaeon]|nr:helix-turn-helix domain-containing protein [Candidatus Micrarchaeota archaeon]